MNGSLKISITYNGHRNGGTNIQIRHVTAPI